MSFVKSSRVLVNALTAFKQSPCLINKNQLVCAVRLSSTLRFTDKHEWIRVEGNIGTVGITDYAQVGFLRS